MQTKKIKSKEDYEKALSRLEFIGDHENFHENQELLNEFDLISSLILSYETRNYQFDPGHPLEMIKLKMNSLGIKQKDLVPLIGSSGVVSEVFNRKRGLSKDMIREFSNLLHIDQNALNLKYELIGKVSKAATKHTISFSFPYLKSVNTVVSDFRNRVKNNGMLFNINAA